MVRVLVFSTLYPNAAQPNHGVFLENRLRHTLEFGGVEATVIAPVPYFPSASPVFGRYATFARAPERETRQGLEVLHPRYLVIPKLGIPWTPEFMFRSALKTVRELQAQGHTFDVIDAHYFYPDGVAAARLGQALKLPVVITGHGTDLTLIPETPNLRSQIQWAAHKASALVTVAEDLRRKLIGLGAPEARTLVLRNGVDLKRFRPVDRDVARAALGVEGFVLVSVGSLIPRKGHDLTIEALTRHTDCTLLIAGSGPIRGELEALAQRLGVANRVRFLGEVPHHDLPMVYSAADVMVLASAREGWANVLMESMACGVPVLATDVNGTRECIRSPAAGLLLRNRTPAALAGMLEKLRGAMPSREATRRYSEGFGWEEVGRANRALLTAVGADGFEHRRSVENVREARRHLAAASLEGVD